MSSGPAWAISWYPVSQSTHLWSPASVSGVIKGKGIKLQIRSESGKGKWLCKGLCLDAGGSVMAVPVVLLYPAATGRLSCPSPTVTVNLKGFKYSQADLVFIHLSLALTLPVKLHVGNLRLMNSLNQHWPVRCSASIKMTPVPLTPQDALYWVTVLTYSDAWAGGAEMSDSRSALLVR